MVATLRLTFQCLLKGHEWYWEAVSRKPYWGGLYECVDQMRCARCGRTR
jgi:hypothetical protein